MKLITIILISLMSMYSNIPLLILSMWLVSVSLTLMIPSKMMLSWFTFIFFMLMLGGIVILFSYMLTLAPNSPPLTLMKTPFYLFIGMLMMLINTTDQMSPSFYTMKFNSIMNNQSAILISTMIILTLILMLILMKLSTKWEGPIRRSYN